MDVDPLRPKNVPLSDETVLWFEFLLTPELLTKHLTKENPDPSAIELMKQFLSITPEYPPDPIPLDDEPQEIKIDLLKYGRKHLALKILTLKIASHLNWNLEIIEQNLTIRKQVQILSDLCSITTAKINKSAFSYDEASSDTTENPKHAVNFARTLYNRWVLRVQVNKEFPYINKTCFGQVLPKEESALLMRFITSLEPHTTKSINFLKKIYESPEPFKILTYDSFNALLPNSDRINQNFNTTKTISKAELRTQVYYDMSTYYLYSKNYDLSREYLTLCAENLKILKSEYESNKTQFLFCTVDETILNGYLLANAIIIPETNLVHQMCTSSLNKYAGIIDILKKDNLIKEIPLVQRKTLELHIEAEISSGIISNNYESASLYVPALNTIRIIIDDNHNNIIANTNYFTKNKYNQKAYDILIEVTKHFLKNSNNLTEKLKIKDYFLNILLSDLCTLNLEKSIQSLKLFNENELIELKRYDNEFIDDYLITLDNNVEFTDFKNQKLQRRQYEKELISCTTANKVRKMLVKIVTPNSSFNKLLYQVNPSWSIPSAIKPVVKALPRGFLQDFCYILLGKAREMTIKKDFNNALSILYQLKLETQRPDLSTSLIVTKLNKLISWEILLVQIYQYLDEWPIKKFNDKQTLIKKCKECVALLSNNQQNQTASGSSNTNDLQLIPRNEIIGYCLIMLLNLNEYDTIINIDDKTGNKLLQYDLVTVFAQAAIDIENYKINKHNRDAWDLVVSIFLQNNNCNNSNNNGNGNNNINNNNKRNNSQQNRDSPIFLTNTNLNPFLDKLRDPLIISLILSLLARIFNILKDEANLDLHAEYIFLWPTNISNANGYSITHVSETLYYLLNIGLKYYPQNIAWLKLKGDLDLSNNNFDSAMKNYINSIMTGTEYCTLIIQRQLIDDCLIRKMIKCCTNLGCHMQATVLCQFLDDIDYGIAFKNISENKLNSSDAMDGYYNFIWDTTLLEFIINMHGKRGEHTRKLQTITHMGLLELNANNNDDIKREAATIRKTKFLRVLAKQYML